MKLPLGHPFPPVQPRVVPAKVGFASPAIAPATVFAYLLSLFAELGWVGSPIVRETSGSTLRRCKSR